MITSTFYAITDFLANLFGANGVRPKSFLGLTQLVSEFIGFWMQCRMLTSWHNLKILDSIVKFFAVDVMNDFRAQQWTPKMLFHDVAMLSDLSAVDYDDSITTAIDCPTLNEAVTGASGTAINVRVSLLWGTINLFAAGFALKPDSLFAHQVRVLTLEFVVMFTTTKVSLVNFAGKSFNLFAAMGATNLDFHICLQLKTLFADAINVFAEKTRLAGKECRKQYMGIASYCQTMFSQRFPLYHSTGVIS